MPNHVVNEIRLHDVSIDDVNRVIASSESPIDFEVLLPIPLNYWQHDEGLKHKENMAGLAMEWSTKNWGTKWNAYDVGGQSVKKDGADVVLTFQTAWNHPRPWVTALFNTLKCNITASWFSEGGYSPYVEKWTSGDGTLSNRPDWNKTKIEVSSPEYRRLHKLLWGVEEFDDDDE